MELGPGEILLILVVALLVYGGRLPEVARAIGKSMGELKRGLTETKAAVAADLAADLDVDLDEPAREVRRLVAEAGGLAKEDVSAPQTGPATDEPPRAGGSDVPPGQESV